MRAYCAACRRHSVAYVLSAAGVPPGMSAFSATRKKPPQTFRFEAVIIYSYYRGTTQIDESSTFLMY